MDKLEKLRKEIERRLEELNPKKGTFMGRPLRDVNPKTFPRESELEKLLSFIDSLQEEPVSDDLWNVAEEYALRQVKASTDTRMTKQAYLDLYIFRGLELAVAFKDGANWAVKQMKKDAMEVEYDNLVAYDIIYKICHTLGKGGKGKLIVIKEE